MFGAINKLGITHLCPAGLCNYLLCHDIASINVRQTEHHLLQEDRRTGIESERGGKKPPGPSDRKLQGAEAE